MATYTPGCAVWWSVYAVARRRLAEERSRRSDTAVISQLAATPLALAPDALPLPPSWRVEGLAGLLAGVASAVVTHPLDTIKTRLQTGVDGAGATWASALRRLLRTAGPRGLLRGLGARTLELGPLSAVGALGYEWVKRASAT
jgi:solute carrier family 25 protein 44